MDTGASAKIVRGNVTEWLAARGVLHKVHSHSPVHNAREAAAAGLDFDLSLLIKTLIYRTPTGWLLVAMRALDRVDHGALAKAASIERRKLRFAHDRELGAFGWEAGGAAPIPIIAGVTVLVDDAVLRLPLIYFGGGRRDLTIEAEPQALFSRLHYKTASIARS